MDIQSISVKPHVATSRVLSLAADVGEPPQISSTICSALSNPNTTVFSTQTQHKQETTVSVTQQAIHEPFFGTLASDSNRDGEQPCNQSLSQAMSMSKSELLSPIVSSTQLKMCTKSLTKSLPSETTVQNVFKAFTKTHQKKKKKKSVPHAPKKSAELTYSGTLNYFINHQKMLALTLSLMQSAQLICPLRELYLQLPLVLSLPNLLRTLVG